MRADKYFADHYGSRTKAAEAISRGEVLKRGKPLKASDEINDGYDIEFIAPKERYVSGGGMKLARALQAFKIDVKGMIFADIGASTGGFTDCLLQNGTKKVYCVDVGESLLDRKLQNDGRIVRMENTNARYLTADDFKDELDGVVADLSFISLRLILPVLYNIIKTDGLALVLIKPQFECENKNLLSKNGIVTDKKLRRKIVEKIYDLCLENKLYPQNLINAPLRERKNVEYVILLTKDASSFANRKTMGDKADALI